MDQGLQQVKGQPDVLHVDVHESRILLTIKMVKALRYAFEQYNATFDWILKCDVDTYIIMENLKTLLSHLDPRTPAYIGHHMKPGVQNGYMSGGAGYVISSSALRHLNLALANGSCQQTKKDEDVYIGQCLQNIGIPVLSSLDMKQRETFHTDRLRDHLVPPYTKALWNRAYSWNKAKYGQDCCSPYSISFHHLSANDILVYEHLLYRTDVIGRRHEVGNGRIFNLKKVSRPRLQEDANSTK